MLNAPTALPQALNKGKGRKSGGMEVPLNFPDPLRGAGPGFFLASLSRLLFRAGDKGAVNRIPEKSKRFRRDIRKKFFSSLARFSISLGTLR